MPVVFKWTITRLRISDIDADRMVLNIALGKGAKQRQTRLSPRLLEALRESWRKDRPTDFLFPGKRPDKPYAATSIQKAIKASAKRAGITQRVRLHGLRHSWATGMLEAGVDLLTITRLLGHSSVTTTMIYQVVFTLPSALSELSGMVFALATRRRTPLLGWPAEGGL